jgi:hypothetical protein
MSLVLNGTTGITNLPSINSGQIGGRRNIIINGAQEVDQRNAGASVAAAAVYVTDRWKVQTAGNAGDAEQITSTIGGFKSSLKYTGDASIAWCQIGQQIEFKNYAHLVGEDVTISFYAKANNTNGGSTALTVRTRTVTGEDGSALFAGSATDTSVTISTTAARYTVTRTIPADSKGFSVEFALGAHVNTDGLEITGIQLELGTVTAFEHRSFNEELALCQRYFTKSFPYGTAPAQNAGITGAITGQGQAASSPAYAYVTFKNTMRATPTIVTFNPNATNANWRNTTSGGALTVAVQFTGDSGTFIGSNTEVLAQYQLCAIHYTASAEF